MTRAAVEQLLGAASESKDGDLVYKYDDRSFREVSLDTTNRREVVRTKAVGVGVQVRYEHDAATRIKAWYFWENAVPRP